MQGLHSPVSWGKRRRRRRTRDPGAEQVAPLSLSLDTLQLGTWGTSSSHMCTCPGHTEHSAQAKAGLVSSSVILQPSQDTPPITLEPREAIVLAAGRQTRKGTLSSPPAGQHRLLPRHTGAPLRVHSCAPLRAHICSPAHTDTKARDELPSLPRPWHRCSGPGQAVQAALTAAGPGGISEDRVAAGLFGLAQAPQQCQKQQQNRKLCKVLKLFSKYFQFGKESLDVILL